MGRTRRWRAEARLALEVPTWTGRFYLRHVVLIVGVSLIPSVQRLAVVNPDVHLPAPIVLASEVVVMAIRIALVVVVWRIATRGVGVRSWANARAFAREHWRALVVQSGFLGVAFLVFDVGAEALVGRENLALLLFVKNPTIIALTMVWWVGVLKQMMTTGHDVFAGDPLEWKTRPSNDSEAARR
ncbi:hypothetical protein [Umezawaea sp. Da 62-37]|uniref:hypothetical protein n=1 Tax=Umezawaea sp. Da 62-37 TaxID=3075927 RepID=UPI0028F6FB27|nr:hypothetical protein [Umezawaea sp. Da 62-37]WNV84400.1 hypothetical protein RM788_40560 [Umezawaea sp. Da 62-37]